MIQTSLNIVTIVFHNVNDMQVLFQIVYVNSEKVCTADISE